MKLLVTGGSGFIGSAFIRYILSLEDFDGEIVNLDALTYAANPDALKGVEQDPRYTFVKGSVTDVEQVFQCFSFTHVVHFAAESHVDRSITSAMPFVESNVMGTVALLEEVRKRPWIQFHHVSTDEVYGSIADGEFTETSPYAPNSPYSASKAASDHFVRAYHKTYGLKTTISHCCNNYGMFQHDEKFIPTVVRSILSGRPVPIYGDGSNIREWIHADDHSKAVWKIVTEGVSGEVYGIGTGELHSNKDVVEKIIEILGKGSYRFVADRKGHDFRYALSSEKIRNELGWKPRYSFEEGLREVVEWYVSQVSVVCVIPARLKSTRFPKKILHEIQGKPMVQWTYEAACATGLFSKVLIAIDDEETEQVVSGFTKNYVMTEPGIPSGTKRLCAVREMGYTADVWVNWQCDEPLVNRAMIETLLSRKHEKGARVWTLRKETTDRSPHVVKVVTAEDDRALYFSREAIPHGGDLYKHIGLYAFTDQALEKISDAEESALAKKERLEQLTFLAEGIPIYAFKTDHESVGVDVLEDVAALLSTYRSTSP